MNVMKRKVIKREACALWARAGAVMDDRRPFCLFDFPGLQLWCLSSQGWVDVEHSPSQSTRVSLRPAHLISTWDDRPSFVHLKCLFAEARGKRCPNIAALLLSHRRQRWWSLQRPGLISGKNGGEVHWAFYCQCFNNEDRLGRLFIHMCCNIRFVIGLKHDKRHLLRTIFVIFDHANIWSNVFWGNLFGKQIDKIC